ncbi:MAG: MFS transporter [Bifidobacteriaceae bacterium]|jgi:MFS family permease|nr:MFS transporter [Bifidobacteriaceae bacterium]
MSDEHTDPAAPDAPIADSPGTDSTEAAGEAERQGDRVGLPRIVTALAVVNALTRVAWVATATILLPVQIIAAVGEANKETWIGIITTVGTAVGIVFSPLVGRWSDRTRSRLGRRAPWLLAGAAGAAVAYAMVGLFTQSITLLVAWCLQQAAYMAITMATNTVLPERVPLKKRGLVTGVTALVAVGAALTASFIGAAFISNVVVGMFLMGGLCLVGAVCFVVLAPMRSSKGLGAAGESRKGFSFADFVSAFKNRNYRWMWIGIACMTLAYQFILSRAVYFCQAWFDLELQAAADTTAAAVAVGGLAQMVAMVAVGPLSDKLGRRPFMYAGGVVQAGGLLFVLTTHNPGVFLGAYSVVCLGAGLFMGAQLPLAADVLPDGQDFGQDIGFYQLSNQLPQMLAPALGTLILAVSGTYAAMMVVGAVASLLGVVAIVRIKGVR